VYPPQRFISLKTQLFIAIAKQAELNSRSGLSI